MANKNFKARIGIEAPLIAADNGTTAITLSDNDVTVVGDLTVTSNTIKSSSATALTLSGANVAVAGTLELDGNIIKASDGTTALTTSAGTGNVAFAGNIDVQGGTITESTGALSITTGAANGNITLDPNGTGNVVLTLADGGNLTNTRNYVAGALRNSTLATAGDIWALNSTGPTNPYRGVSLDNSADNTKGAGAILRSYSNANGLRGRVVFERARGSLASPAALQTGNIIGSVDATGYTSTGWLNDNISAVVPAFFGFSASENWVSNTNIGSRFFLSLAPSATTITDNANLITTIESTPESTALRSDRLAFSQGKTSVFTATGCSTSGTTLTIGTLVTGTIAVGNVITVASSVSLQNYYIISGSGSTWTLNASPGTLSSQAITGNIGYIGGTTSASVDMLADLKLLKNTIKGSGGTTQITTSSAGATLALAGDAITLESSAGTDYAVFSNNNILNNRATRNAITTATVTEGATYTPAATDNNSISLTVNTGSGTTIIDLINLTGQGTGGMYTIMIHNNAASGTPIQIKNTRINTNNLTTHTIPTGDRIMVTAYIVGDYATAEHLNVA